MRIGRVLLVLLGAGTAWAALAACSHPAEPVSEPAMTGHMQPPAPTTRPVVDLPSLLALKVDEMPARLGPRQPLPALFDDPGMLLNDQQIKHDSLACFRYHGLEMVVNFDARSRRITDLLLLGANEDQLMQQGQLSLDASTYLLVPLFRPRSDTALLGLRVVPANLSHLDE